MEFGSLDTSGNPRANALDIETVNKGGCRSILSFCFFNGDLWKNRAMQLCVDMIKLYSPLEFASEIYVGHKLTCGKSLKQITENLSFSVNMEIGYTIVSFSVQYIAFRPSEPPSLVN